MFNDPGILKKILPDIGRKFFNQVRLAWDGFQLGLDVCLVFLRFGLGSVLDIGYLVFLGLNLYHKDALLLMLNKEFSTFIFTCS